MDVKTEEDQSNEAFLPPPLPNLTPTPDLPTISTFGRKRTLDFDVTLSSDPPLFSSDDLPASSENYAHRRKKRRYPGTWWGAKACEGEDQAMELRRRTRGLKRTADSGVWMGSEDTDLSLEEGSEPRLVDDLPKWEPPNEVNVGSRPMVSQGTDFTGARVDATMGSSVQKVDNIEEEEESLEQRAIQIVQYCLDESIETVDLSGLQLERISPTTIRPLKHLTKTPEIDHHPPSQEAYSPLTPTLHLYLSRNMLRAIPGELFNLKYLTVLSLRNNKLTELPSAIANLENLVELNVGGNRLKWLPWEILKLVAGQLRILNVYPNPLFEPPRSRNGAEGVEAMDKVKKAFELLHRGPTPQASTAVTFMNFDGSICRGMPTAPSSAMYAASLVISSLPNYWPADLDWPSTSQVPSLLELALGECSQSPYLSQLPELLPEDSPTSIARLLKEAHATKEAGGRICSVCGKSYLIARTEWLEWWNCVVELEMVRTVSYCNTLPLLRRGCSWRCVPTDLDPDRL